VFSLFLTMCGILYVASDVLNKLDEVVMLLACVQEMPRPNLCWDTDYPD
jgi:hypothetical protein